MTSDPFKRFEPGQTWRTGGDELWLVTHLDVAQGKVSFLIVDSPIKSLAGKPSWFFPREHDKLFESFTQVEGREL